MYIFLSRAIGRFMDIEISRREVLNNIIRFKDSLYKPHIKGTKEQRVYTALVNRKTGDMRFAKKISELESHFSSKTKKEGQFSDWKEVRLIAKDSKERPFVHFEVQDEKGKTLSNRDLDSLSWRVVSETLEVLNIKAKEIEAVPPTALAEEVALKDLSSIRISQAMPKIEDLPGWKGAISREEAEVLLKGCPYGTYLIREGDLMTKKVAFHLGVENQMAVAPYLLMFVDQEEKIAEVLILRTEKGWTYYSDDPDLNQPFYHYYKSAGELLQVFSDFAKRALG